MSEKTHQQDLCITQETILLECLKKIIVSLNNQKGEFIKKIVESENDNGN